MKTIQKITLALLTVVSVSSLSAAVLDIAFDEGASYAGAITGGAKFNGVGTLAWTGSADSMEITGGTVQSANANITASVNLNGGHLSMTDEFTKSVAMTQAGSLRLAADSVVNATGANSIVLVGAGKPTLGVIADGITSSASELQINAASRAGALVSVSSAAILANPSAALGADLTVLGNLNASAVGVTGANLGVLTVGGILNIGANAWNKDVTAS